MLSILKKCFGDRIRVMPQLDQDLVDAFLAEWNRDRAPDNPLWRAVPGTHSVMEMVINPDGTVVFNGNRGFPLKVFKNIETQELKFVDARRFARVA